MMPISRSVGRSRLGVAAVVAVLVRAGRARGLPKARLPKVAGILEAAWNRLGFAPDSESPEGGRPAAAPAP